MFSLAMKRAFFDRRGVARRMSKARRRWLSRVGAFVRQRAKTSIRKPPGRGVGRDVKGRFKSRGGGSTVSPVGKPPYSHVGTLRRRIYFAYYAANDSVVIGPELTNNAEALKALERGGTSTVSTLRRGRRMKRRAKIRPRPFMRPALEAEVRAGTLAKAWADQFNK